MTDPVLNHLDKGQFANGYDSDDVNRAFGAIKQHLGVDLICVWEYFDDAGYGGSSEFYLVEGNAAYELAGDLWPWLSGDTDAEHPGSPDQWKGATASGIDGWQDYPGDGFSNYAPK